MSLKEKMAAKVCNFYVNNWHLLTILFPYLNKNLDEKTKIVTILEDNLEDYAQTLIEKIILNNQDKDKIMDINWRKTNIENKNFENYLTTNTKGNNELILIVNGQTDYIENANETIYDLINKKEMTNKTVKIINCFNVSNNSVNMSNILNNHETVLNTLGEIKVEEFTNSNK